jgi:hypothetical protein
MGVEHFRLTLIMTPTDAGYGSAAYAAALSDFGEPLPLRESGGWLLRRSIPGFSDQDAMGCYPLFTCANWGGLDNDLRALAGSLVSVVLVTDPFGSYTEDGLHRAFPDLCTRYKEHYFVELEHSSPDTVSSHHRRNARRGLKVLDVDFCKQSSRYLPDWIRLYGNLNKRHGIRGISAFSDASFAAQMEVPGLVMQRAVYGGETVGMILWLVSGSVAYYHLGAYTDEGYDLRASFALFWTALEHFQGRVEFLALGASAGAQPQSASGLDRFKAGWATGTRTAYLCGRILSPLRYAALVDSRGVDCSSYFPAYRAGLES